MNRALELHKSNDIVGAKKIYTEILDSYPNHFDSAYLMGVIAIGESDFKKAKNFLIKALETLPNHSEAHFNLGVVYEKLVDTKNALNHYSEAIKNKGDFIEALYNRAALKAGLNLLPEALEDIECLLKLNPGMAAAQESKNAILERLNLDPSRPNNENSKAGNKEARLFIELHEAGLNFFKAGKHLLALDSFNKALLIHPKRPEALHNKGMVLERMGKLNEALQNYKDALSGAPDSAPTLNNMGNVLRELGQYEQSIAYFEKAIEIKPEYAEAYSNLGWTLYTIRRFEDALISYEKALSINPNLTEALFNSSLCNLMLGEFKNGWLNYEHRKSQPFYAARKFSTASWTGSEPLANKSILIYSEQGLGDTIQFCRYIKKLADQGAKVFFEPQPALRKLLSNLDGVVQIVTSPSNNFDYQCSLMSLPLAFKTSTSTIPNQIPYLKPEESKVDKWSSRLDGIKGPKVGLVWSGGFRPNQPELWAVNERRNISFPKISNLNIGDIQFFSLQKGEKAELELKETKNQFWSSSNFWDFTGDLNDFSDTAALIECLDLVISVDTSTAHLAAALGKQTWILNRFDNCWRWLADGKDSAWYPTAKLYRQKTMGNWDDVLIEVKNDLLKKFSQ